jgi:hypothetical protein
VKVSMQSMLQLIIDELEYASTVGIQVIVACNVSRKLAFISLAYFH